MCDHCGCRAFPGIAELTAEHDTILSLAWEVAERTRRGDPPDPVGDSPLIALLATHAAKEETGLYPLLRAAQSLSDETSAALEAEHRELHDVLDSGRFDRREYYALAAHIEQEELELFPEAMFAFEDDAWSDVEAAHRRVDDAAAAGATSVG